MITIDTREPCDKICDILANWTHGVIPSIDFKALKLGDYLVQANGYATLIERKEIGDLIANYKVLRRRLDKMRDTYDSTILLVEGNYQIKDGRIYVWRGQTLTDAWGHHTYNNLLINQQRKGTMYMHTFSLEESLLSMFELEAALLKQNLKESYRKVYIPASACIGCGKSGAKLPGKKHRKA